MLRLIAAPLVLVLAILLGCSRSAPSTRNPERFADSYGYENDDDPGHDEGDTDNCDPNTCKSPMVCLQLVTDTTLAVSDRKAPTRCVSPDSDLCRLDAAACTNPAPFGEAN